MVIHPKIINLWIKTLKNIKKMAEIFAYSAIFLYLCTRKMGFRSSVGLEQRPSKAWV